MNDRVKEVLKIDAFGEAVGRNQQPLLRLAHSFDAGTPLLRGQFTRDGLDAELGKDLSQGIRHMIGGGDEPAEHDPVRTLDNQGLEQLCYRFEFRICHLGQAFGLRHEGGERSVLF